VFDHAHTFFFSEVDLLQKALENEDLLPKYREYIKQRIEESSPVDYREIKMPAASLVAVSYIQYKSSFF
jgi:hypothetical protein